MFAKGIEKDLNSAHLTAYFLQIEMLMSTSDYFLDDSEDLAVQNDIADIEVDIVDQNQRKAKPQKPSDLKTKERIYQLQEERRLNKLMAEYDWD